jgi:hypothetical protein
MSRSQTPAAFEPAGKPPRLAHRFSMRAFAVRHARSFERAYNLLLRILDASRPMLAFLGFERLERPARFLERSAKGVLFDCRMCGSCILSSTGMSCPMNCPKTLRNGPCGGVRSDGRCEVDPAMTCVFVLGWEGSRNMVGGDAMLGVLPPLDHRLQGRSSWLRHLRGVRP